MITTILVLYHIYNIFKTKTPTQVGAIMMRKDSIITTPIKKQIANKRKKDILFCFI